MTSMEFASPETHSFSKQQEAWSLQHVQQPPTPPWNIDAVVPSAMPPASTDFVPPIQPALTPADSPMSPVLPIQNPADEDMSTEKASTRSGSFSQSSSTKKVSKAPTGTALIDDPQNALGLHIPKKKASSMFGFLTLKDPSTAAFDEFAQQQRKHAVSKGGHTTTVGMSGVSSQKLPSSVPKVNSKWDGLPQHPRERLKIATDRRDSAWSPRSPWSMHSASIAAYAPRSAGDGDMAESSPIPSSNVLPDDNKRREFPFFRASGGSNARSPRSLSTSTSPVATRETRDARLKKGPTIVPTEHVLPRMPTISSLTDEVLAHSREAAVNHEQSALSTERTQQQSSSLHRPSPIENDQPPDVNSAGSKQCSHTEAAESQQSQRQSLLDRGREPITDHDRRANVEAYLDSQDDKHWVSGLDEMTVSSSGLDVVSSPERFSVVVPPVLSAERKPEPSPPFTQPLGSESKRQSGSHNGTRPTSYIRPSATPIKHSPPPASPPMRPLHFSRQAQCPTPFVPIQTLSSNDPHSRPASAQSRNLHARNFSKPFNPPRSQAALPVVSPPEAQIPKVPRSKYAPNTSSPAVGEVPPGLAVTDTSHDLVLAPLDEDAANESDSSTIAHVSPRREIIPRTGDVPNEDRRTLSSSAPSHHGEPREEGVQQQTSEDVSEEAKDFALSTAFWETAAMQTEQALRSDKSTFRSGEIPLESRLDGPFDPMNPF